MLEKVNKEVYQRCKHCHCIIEIKKVFTENEKVCNMCINLLKNEDKVNPNIFIIWTKNQKYRVFTNFHGLFVDRVMKHENIKDKCGKISYEVIGYHLNTCDCFI